MRPIKSVLTFIRSCFSALWHWMSRREHEKNPFIFPTTKYSSFIIYKVIEVIRCVYVLLSSLLVPASRPLSRTCLRYLSLSLSSIYVGGTARFGVKAKKRAWAPLILIFVHGCHFKNKIRQLAKDQRTQNRNTGSEANSGLTGKIDKSNIQNL
jgi:hypothetical protein